MIIHSEVVPSEIASESASEIAPESVSFCPALHFYCFCQKVDYLILRYVILNRILSPWSYAHKSDDKCFVWEVFQVVKLGFPLFHSYISLPTPLVSCVDVSVCLIFCFSFLFVCFFSVRVTLKIPYRIESIPFFSGRHTFYEFWSQRLLR